MKREMCTKVTKTIDTTAKKYDAKNTDDRNIASEVYGYQNGYFLNNTVFEMNQYERLYQNQNCMINEIKTIDNKCTHIMNGMRKPRRRVIDAVLVQDAVEGNYLKIICDDGMPTFVPLFMDIKEHLEVYRVSVQDEKFCFAVIYLKSIRQSVVISVSEIKGSALYNAFVRNGIRMNTKINKQWIVNALNCYVLEQITQGERVLNLSGLAGWEDKEYKCAESLEYLKDYRYVTKLPVFTKHFEKCAIPNVMTEEYINCMKKIKNTEHRVLFALMPFAGMMFSIMKEKGYNIPIVLNLIILEEVNIDELLYYFQIFNRTNLAASSVNDTEKNIKRLLAMSKDEVLCFVGIHHVEDTAYTAKKISNNLNYIAKKAMNKSGLEYGEKAVQTQIVLLSNERIAQHGVKNLFIEKEFWNQAAEDVSVRTDSVQAVLSLFIWYVETNWEDVMKTIDQELKVNCKEEAYWKILIRMVDRFWKIYGTDFNRILCLPDDFSYEFLWADDVCYLEDTAESVIRIVRQSVAFVDPVHKEKCSGSETFIVDDKYIWISPETFSLLIDKAGFYGQKERMLLGAKEANLLCVSEYGGYTTRLQINGCRRDFYKFNKQSFNKVGLINVFD